MEAAGENNKISQEAWKEWTKSPDNIQVAFGRASQFLVAL
jgi:hypothetical protein